MVTMPPSFARRDSDAGRPGAQVAQRPIWNTDELLFLGEVGPAGVPRLGRTRRCAAKEPSSSDHCVATRNGPAGARGVWNQPAYLTTEEGMYLTTEDGNYLVVEHGWQQCQLVAGDAIVPLPAWAQSITK
jgi:hypothetical protein